MTFMNKAEHIPPQIKKILSKSSNPINKMIVHTTWPRHAVPPHCPQGNPRKVQLLPGATETSPCL